MAAAVNGRSPDLEFVIEEMSTGVFASGYGQCDDGCSFSFQVRPRPRSVQLTVEVYRRGAPGPVPRTEDVVATTRRDLGDVDITDERSLAAVIRDAVAQAR